MADRFIQETIPSLTQKQKEILQKKETITRSFTPPNLGTQWILDSILFSSTIGGTNKSIAKAAISFELIASMLLDDSLVIATERRKYTIPFVEPEEEQELEKAVMTLNFAQPYTIPGGHSLSFTLDHTFSIAGFIPHLSSFSAQVNQLTLGYNLVRGRRTPLPAHI